MHKKCCEVNFLNSWICKKQWFLIISFIKCSENKLFKYIMYILYVGVIFIVECLFCFRCSIWLYYLSYHFHTAVLKCYKGSIFKTVKSAFLQSSLTILFTSASNASQYQKCTFHAVSYKWVFKKHGRIIISHMFYNK